MEPQDNTNSMTPLNDALEEGIELLRAMGKTVGFAESCTGGLLSASMTAFAGVSEVFKGSVVSYSNDVKISVLNVGPQVLAAKGAVSDQVACQMAEGVRDRLNVDYSVAITGIAGPSGGTAEKPVGTVWIAVCGPGILIVRSALFTGLRRQIQIASCLAATRLLIEALRK